MHATPRQASESQGGTEGRREEGREGGREEGREEGREGRKRTNRQPSRIVLSSTADKKAGRPISFTKLVRPITTSTSSVLNCSAVLCPHPFDPCQREGWKEGGREAGKETGRKGGRRGGKEGRREGRREGRKSYFENTEASAVSNLTPSSGVGRRDDHVDMVIATPLHERHLEPALASQHPRHVTTQRKGGGMACATQTSAGDDRVACPSIYNSTGSSLVGLTHDAK